MSSFISFVTPDAAFLLTDGGIWSTDSLRLMAVQTKAWHAKRQPLAVTTRGDSRLGERVATVIAKFADEESAAETILNLQNFALNMREEFGELTGLNTVQVLVSAWLPGVGGVHRMFQTMPYESRVRKAPYEVWEPPGPLFSTGSRLTSLDLAENGLRAPPGETADNYIRRTGPEMMEIMRRRPATHVVGGHLIPMVGGKCDLTTIDASGARTETLRVWDDEIGTSPAPFLAAIAA